MHSFWAAAGNKIEFFLYGCGSTLLILGTNGSTPKPYIKANQAGVMQILTVWMPPRGRLGMPA
jgi:hypothetical protein